MNRKYVILLIIAISLVGLFFYKKYIRINTKDTGYMLEKNNDQTLRQGLIINMKDGEYEKLNQGEKQILKSIFQNPKNDYPVADAELSNLFLKYYDDNIAISGIIVIKPSAPFWIFDRKNQMFLNTDTSSALYAKKLNYYLGYFENNQYMISAYDDGIIYYKIAEDNIKLLPNSALKAGETYSKTNDMIDTYEISIAATSPKVLRISVFEKVDSSEFNTKLREVEYVLP